MVDVQHDNDLLVLLPEQLNVHASVENLRLKPISRAKLAKLLVSATDKIKTSLTRQPVMELSARHPYDPAGFMDFYRPGRWDCEIDLVFMSAIVSTGPSPGQWDGTVGYVRFKAPKAGDYLVVVNFSGYQITMQASGPWGSNTAYTPTTAASSAVTAPWTATKDQQLYFTVSCKGPILGYLQSVQVFQI